MAIEERCVEDVCVKAWIFIGVVLRPVSISDYPALEKVSDMAIKDKQKFERLVVSKEKLLEMFAVSFLPMTSSCELTILGCL